MQYTISILNKEVQVSLDDAAFTELGNRTQPLYAEMELYFSCLIRYKVRFYDSPVHKEFIPVSDKLYVSFRPVMTEKCDTYEGAEPPVTDFPIARPQAFVPRWLKLNFLHNNWEGEFGINRERQAV